MVRVARASPLHVPWPGPPRSGLGGLETALERVRVRGGRARPASFASSHGCLGLHVPYFNAPTSNGPHLLPSTPPAVHQITAPVIIFLPL